jgi:hypothetical protein
MKFFKNFIILVFLFVAPITCKIGKVILCLYTLLAFHLCSSIWVFCLSLSMFDCLFVFMSFWCFCLSAFLSFCLSVLQSFCVYVFPYFCVSVFLYFCLSVFLLILIHNFRPNQVSESQNKNCEIFFCINSAFKRILLQLFSLILWPQMLWNECRRILVSQT